MKENKFVSVITVVALFFFGSLLLSVPSSVSAAEKMKEKDKQMTDKCYPLGIHGQTMVGSSIGPASQASSISIDTPYLSIPKGSCVVWVNWVPQREVTISFKEGKVCEDVTESPMGFTYRPESGCFVTDFIPLGGTSSLRFMQAGTYKYDIFLRNGIAPVATGEITVK